MLTGEIRNQIDRIWDAFWAGGIANPLEVIEQITYLLFLKRLDELHTAEENKANRLKTAIEKPVFGPDQQMLRWSRFKNLAPAEMYETVANGAFPFIKDLKGVNSVDSSYARNMKDARFTIPTPGLLAKVVELIDQVPMQDRDTKGDVYEYILSKLSTAGQNGQFRTPRHIIRLIVELTQPKPADIICNPACGTCGFLMIAGEFLRENHPEIFSNVSLRQHFNSKLFHGFDFDATMLRIGSMNMLLHGIEEPDVRYKDSLSEEHATEDEKYTLILANPPFAGALDYESSAKDLQKIVKTKKTELLFVALFLRLLKPGGRAAVIVPEGVLFGSSTAHKAIRKLLVEGQKLEAVISLPSGVFRPYAGVSTAILVFTKTNSGGTDHVWFYHMEADGFSLDDKREALLPTEKLGPTAELTSKEHERNNLPDIIHRWRALRSSVNIENSQSNGSSRVSTELARTRIEQSFLVPKAEILANDYDLSINRYRAVAYEEVPTDPPEKILAELDAIEQEIQKGLKDLQKMLG
jgi:type I restriction enzyme M protein